MPYMKRRESESIKKQICTVYNNNGDWRDLANALGVKKTTVYRWVRNQNEVQGKHGGKRRVKITEEHRAFMTQYVEQNPRITLKELKRKFEEDHHVTVSTECLRQHLDGLMFTLKDIRREPERANSEETKAKRCEYVRQLLNYQSDNIPIIYMDETNFNLYISRRQGRSKKGTRCTNIAAGTRGKNVHVIGCIGNLGLIYSQFRRGPFKIPEANEFVHECLRAAQNMYQSSVVLVLDNAPCHRNVEAVFAEEEFRNHRLLRLSPYSPMFNPIELAWSSFKATVKQSLSVQLPHILTNEDRGNLTQTEYRLRQLENILAETLHTINVNNCARYVAHVQRFIPDALNLNDMPM